MPPPPPSCAVRRECSLTLMAKRTSSTKCRAMQYITNSPAMPLKSFRFLAHPGKVGVHLLPQPQPREMRLCRSGGATRSAIGTTKFLRGSREGGKKETNAVPLLLSPRASPCKQQLLVMVFPRASLPAHSLGFSLFCKRANR